MTDPDELRRRAAYLEREAGATDDPVLAAGLLKRRARLLHAGTGERVQWHYFTCEPGWNGTHGPWGPFVADTLAEAEMRAYARAVASGRTLDRVERAA